MEGIFTPAEILYNNDLTLAERYVLSIYYYYTKNGKYKCCSLTNEEVAKKANISLQRLKEMKPHLKKLGLIKTSGNKVYYLGEQNETKKEYENHTTTSMKIIPEEYENHTRSSMKNTPHNKENKNNKENKENKESKTNFDQALDNLTDYYKTTEKIEYLKSNYGEYINKINSIDDDLSIDSISKNIKNAIIKKFGVEPIQIIDIEKKESTCHSIEEIVDEVSKERI